MRPRNLTHWRIGWLHFNLNFEPEWFVVGVIVDLDSQADSWVSLYLPLIELAVWWHRSEVTP